MEERKIDEKLDKEVQELLNAKEYTYLGWNPNTMYEMVKLYLLGDEYNISSQTRERVGSHETLQKFQDVFGKTEDVVNCICKSVSEGDFDEFEKICSKFGIPENHVKALVERLQKLYDGENEKVNEWNSTYEARRYADYENAAQNLCCDSHDFRKSLDVLDPYVEKTHEKIGEDLLSKESENANFKTFSEE